MKLRNGQVNTFAGTIYIAVDGTYYRKVTNMYMGVAGKAMVSNATLAWLGNGDIRPQTNSSMLIQRP